MPNYLKCVQIKAEYNQLLEMATAFGVRVLGTALVVILDSIDFRDKGPEWAPSPIIAAESKLTTKAVPSNRTPQASPIYAQASNNWLLPPPSFHIKRLKVFELWPTWL